MTAQERRKIMEIERNTLRGRAAGMSWEAIATAIGEPAELLEKFPLFLGFVWDQLLAETRADLKKLPASEWTPNKLFTVTPD